MPESCLDLKFYKLGYPPLLLTPLSFLLQYRPPRVPGHRHEPDWGAGHW